MNREIQFRAWSLLEMTYSNPMPDLGFWKYGAFDSDTVFMQFTGLTDKNGKEIYEGDIVAQDGYLNREIWFEDGTYLIGIKDQSDKHFYQNIAQNVEVIGNIHQNQELLTP
jgi:hypothetical protein